MLRPQRKCKCGCGVKISRGSMGYTLGHNPNSHSIEHNAKVSATIKADKVNIARLIKRNKSAKQRKAVGARYNDPVFAEASSKRMIERNKSLTQRCAVSKAMRQRIKDDPEQHTINLVKAHKIARRKLLIRYDTDPVFLAKMKKVWKANGIRNLNGYIDGTRQVPGICPRFKYKYVETTKGGSFTCRSSWEVLVVKILEKIDSVKCYVHDKVRIPYVYDGTDRVFIVDFLVTLQNKVKLLIEPKGYEHAMLPEKVRCKNKAAKKYCKEHGYKYIYLPSKKAIKEFCILLKEDKFVCAH